MALTTIPSELSSVSGISDSSTSTAITIDSSQDVTFAGNITTGSNTISGVLSSVTGSLGSAATATTQAASDNSTKLATTAYVTTALANMVDSAPSTLDTLNELAAALGDDANFSTTVTNSIAGKVALSGSGQTILDSADFEIDAGGNILLDADGGGIYFQDGSTLIGSLQNSSSDFVVASEVADKDIIFKGIDGSSTITALTLDMSSAGAAAFNDSIDVGNVVKTERGSASAPPYTFKDDLDTGMFNISNANLGFSVSGVERMRIDGSGNVGVGKTAGSIRMDVETDQNGNLAGQFKNTHSSGSYGIKVMGGHDSSNYSAVFTDKDNTTLMMIRGNGNVGIGLDNPHSYTVGANDLVVGGSGSQGITIASGTSNTGNLFFADSTSGNAGYRGYVQYQHSGDKLVLGAAADDRVFITSTGVGIGVTPSAWSGFSGVAQVHNSALASVNNGTYLYANAYYDGSNNRHIATDEASRYYQLGGNHVWETAASATAGSAVSFSERMRIDQYGTLALGTTDTHQWTVFDGRLRMGATACFASTSNSTQMLSNAYYDNNYRYITNNKASRFYLNDGSFYWDIAASGSADGVLSFTEAMRINSSGNVGIGETVPLGKLHIRTADSGASVDVSADELVVEGSGNAGISILSGQSYTGNIYFGDAGVNWDGYIAYSQSQRRFTFGAAAGATSLSIDSSGIYTNSYANDVTNTVYGADAFTSNATGAENNTVIGRSAWYWGTTGDNNVVIGHNACLDNVSNINQMASSVYVGKGSGLYNAGNLNVVIGTEAGYRNYGGSSVLIGYRAGGYYNSSSSGNNNVAVGMNTLYAVTTGSDNVILGRDAGSGLTTGYSNVFLGRDAGDSAVSGYRNICIGQNVNLSANSGTNQIVLGHDISGDSNGTFTFGSSAGVVHNHFGSDASWTRVSDVRLKKNIEDTTLGLSFINDLRTVKYNWKPNHEIDQSDTEVAHLYKEEAENVMDTETTMHGFIAQEVKSALDTAGVEDWAGWIKDSNGVQMISREMFIIPLVKAVQELSAEVTALKAEVAALKGE